MSDTVQDPSKLHIEPLGKEHNRAAFSCGVPALDQYLQKQASQDARRYVTAPFVLCEGESPVVLGYYTLSAISIDVGELPGETARRLPRYPDIPATLIGRLAVDQHRRGERLGECLLMDALYRSLRQAGEIAAAAVVVDAKDDQARRFYEAYDVRIFPDRPNRLFLPMTVAKKIF